MALANIATLLALKGNKVLLVDWDLEAPGLAKYFKHFLTPAIDNKPGVLDILLDHQAHGQIHWQEAVTNINLNAETQLTLLTAGKKLITVQT